jgi:hypothetical protein
LVLIGNKYEREEPVGRTMKIPKKYRKAAQEGLYSITGNPKQLLTQLAISAQKVGLSEAVRVLESNAYHADRSRLTPVNA